MESTAGEKNSTVNLRSFRKDLVTAAEKVVRDANDKDFERWKKSQTANLVNLCARAACPEEIENYLRYQSARRNPPWPEKVVKQAITGIAPVLERLEGDEIKTAAWQLYATYMKRAHTYRAPGGNR